MQIFTGKTNPSRRGETSRKFDLICAEIKKKTLKSSSLKDAKGIILFVLTLFTFRCVLLTVENSCAPLLLDK